MQVANPSSLYNPTLTSRWIHWDNRNNPISLQVSAPSKLPIVSSKKTLFCAMACYCCREWSFRVLANQGGAEAQPVERAIPGEEVPVSIPAAAARSLLVGSVSV